MKSHIISQVVLRQFTDSEGLVKVTNKVNSTSELLKTEEFAYTVVDEALIAESEKQWDREFEKEANKTLNKLNDGGLLHEPKHIQAVKDIMALHYIRSNALLKLLDIFQKRRKKQIIDDLVSEMPDSRDLILHAIERDWPGFVQEALVIVIDDNLPKVQSFLKDKGLEIGYSAQKNFIIGDSPVLTIGDGGRIGPLNGVPITEANSMGMVLTPSHLVTIKDDPETKKYTELDNNQVNAVNVKQVNMAIEEYYELPSESS